MKDEFDEMMEEITKDLDSDLGDFELEQPIYQVWVIGYDENKQPAGLEVLVNEYRDPEKAVEYAKKYVFEERFMTLSIPDNVRNLGIEVEEVVNRDGVSEGVGSIFLAGLKLK